MMEGSGTVDFTGSMNMTDISFAITDDSNGTQWNLVNGILLIIIYTLKR